MRCAASCGPSIDSSCGKVARFDDVNRRFPMERINVVDHPAVADRLARVRDATTPTPVFRRLVEEIGAFLAYEATRSLPLRDERVATPIGPASGPPLRDPAGRRADPARRPRIAPGVPIRHRRCDRRPSRILPRSADARGGTVLCEPARNGSTTCRSSRSTRCSRRATRARRRSTSFRSAARATCAFCASSPRPRGWPISRQRHPTARIVTCAIDDRLSEHGYIVPGLGDAGDRMFGSASSLPMGYRAAR